MKDVSCEGVRNIRGLIQVLKPGYTDNRPMREKTIERHAHVVTLSASMESGLIRVRSRSWLSLRMGLALHGLSLNHRVSHGLVLCRVLLRVHSRLHLHRGLSIYCRCLLLLLNLLLLHLLLLRIRVVERWRRHRCSSLNAVGRWWGRICGGKVGMRQSVLRCDTLARIELQQTLQQVESLRRGFGQHLRKRNLRITRELLYGNFGGIRCQLPQSSFIGRANNPHDVQQLILVVSPSEQRYTGNHLSKNTAT